MTLVEALNAARLDLQHAYAEQPERYVVMAEAGRDSWLDSAVKTASLNEETPILILWSLAPRDIIHVLAVRQNGDMVRYGQAAIDRP